MFLAASKVGKIDIVPILEVARDNLHSEVLGEVLETLEQFRDRVDDPFAYPNPEELKALFEEGQGQGQGQDLDDQEVVQGIA